VNRACENREPPKTASHTSMLKGGISDVVAALVENQMKLKVPEMPRAAIREEP